MNRPCWSLTAAVSRLLAPAERAVVLGDLAESDDSGASALRHIVGLAARRQALLWITPQHWFAFLAMAAPLAILISRPFPFWVAWQLRTLWIHGVRYEVGLPLADDFVRAVCFLMLPILWAWSGGLALGAIARRSAWIHPVFLLPMIAAGVILLRLHLFLTAIPVTLLFAAPFIAGTSRGARGFLPRRAIFTVAIALAALTVTMQIEDARESVAFAAWTRGASLDGSLPWTPQLLPFAAILWQFTLILVLSRRNHAHHASR